MPNWIFEILSGIGIFIFGIFLLNVSLENKKISIPLEIKNKLNKPFMGFLLGSSFTILTQSSSAANSIVVQLSDKGIIQEKVAYYVVIGTNIGTTITAYLAVLSKLNIATVFMLLIFIGSIILMITKRKTLRKFIFFVCILSLIFIGIKIISTTIPYMVNIFSCLFSPNSNPIILLFISLILTAICQSSSLISLLIVSLTGLNLLQPAKAIFMIIGANVGTCSTALLVSFGKNSKGIHVALFNLIFNIIGLSIHIFAYYMHLLDWFINLSVANDTKIALYHTFFNLTSALFILPFVSEINKILSHHSQLHKKLTNFT